MLCFLAMYLFRHCNLGYDLSATLQLIGLFRPLYGGSTLTKFSLIFEALPSGVRKENN